MTSRNVRYLAGAHGTCKILISMKLGRCTLTLSTCEVSLTKSSFTGRPITKHQKVAFRNALIEQTSRVAGTRNTTPLRVSKLHSETGMKPKFLGGRSILTDRSNSSTIQ